MSSPCVKFADAPCSEPFEFLPKYALYAKRLNLDAASTNKFFMDAI